MDFQGSRVTSGGCLLQGRELDERLGLGELIAQHLTDSRRGKKTRLPLADLFRQSVYCRIAGYEDVDDAARLSQDPTFRLIGNEKIWERAAALTSRLQSFESDLLTQEENLAGLAAINRESIIQRGFPVRIMLRQRDNVLKCAARRLDPLAGLLGDEVDRLPPGNQPQTCCSRSRRMGQETTWIARCAFPSG